MCTYSIHHTVPEFFPHFTTNAFYKKKLTTKKILFITLNIPTIERRGRQPVNTFMTFCPKMKSLWGLQCVPIKRDGRGLSSCPSAGGGDSCVAGRVVFRKRYLSFFSPREVSMKYSPTAPKNNYDMNGPSVGSCSSIFTSLPYLFTISGFFISIFIIFGHFRSVVRAVSTFSHILFCQMTHFVINCYHPLSF